MSVMEPKGWPCQCVPPSVQMGGVMDDEGLDFNDPHWHALGCHVRLRAAAMAVMDNLFDVEALVGPRVYSNGLSEQNVDDLYRMVMWWMQLTEQYRRKEAQYGRTWAELGWLAQVAQIYRRARRLLVLGWWSYDETEFNKSSAEQNAEDLATHAYFFVRLLADDNRKGRA